MLIIGDEEEESEKVSIRDSNENEGKKELEEFKRNLKEEVKTKSLERQIL
jgi:threonyl-tRNA synthetase